ncbi:MAG: hypothetical protein KIT10_09945 [Flavobacteriales bacterium]|nr:hypothetical protein [Flavobacteriales bacterium]
MKSRIDHSNYEAWLLDRLEGNLDPERERELDAFLLAHPELDLGLDELPTLGDLEARLPQVEKDALKRSLPPMGMPGETAIDDFLIARLEGDLSPDQAEALRIFLIDHPEHRRAERLYALTKLVPEALAYTAKHGLERQLPPPGLPDRYTLDDFLVARLEGDLTAEQEEALFTYLALEPSAARHWALMGHTRIAAEAVTFPSKYDLKKSGKVIAIGSGGGASPWSVWAPRLRAAAVVAVLLGLGLWLLDRGPEQTSQVAEVVEKDPKGTANTPDPQQNGNAAATQVQVDQAPGAAQDAPRASGDKDPSSKFRQPPVEREEGGLLARVEPLIRSNEPGRVGPRSAEVPEVVISPWEDQPEEGLADAGTEGISLGGFLAGKLRKRVLKEEEADQRPLDTQDAVAAVDKGLRAVRGEGAGLQVGRQPDGRARSWDLRLGPNLAISASR